MYIKDTAKVSELFNVGGHLIHSWAQLFKTNDVVSNVSLTLW